MGLTFYGGSLLFLFLELPHILLQHSFSAVWAELVSVACNHSHDWSPDHVHCPYLPRLIQLRFISPHCQTYPKAQLYYIVTDPGHWMIVFRFDYLIKTQKTVKTLGGLQGTVFFLFSPWFMTQGTFSWLCTHCFFLLECSSVSTIAYPGKFHLWDSVQRSPLFSTSASTVYSVLGAGAWTLEPVCFIH